MPQPQTDPFAAYAQSGADPFAVYAVQSGPRSAATSGLPPAAHSDAHPLSDSDSGESNDLHALLEPLANPRTASDMAGLLVPNFAGVAPAMTNAAAPFVQAAGRGVERLGKMAGPLARRVGSLEAIARGDWKGAVVAAAPSVAEGTGRLMQRTGRAMEAAPMDAAVFKFGERPLPSAPRIQSTSTSFSAATPPPAKPMSWSMERPASASPTAAPAASGLSDVDRTALAKQGYTPEVIAKIEQSSAAGKPAAMASHAPPTTAPTVAPQPELQAPRVRIGAERVGRQAGMAKEEVRAAAGPVLDEAVGEASPILPKQALGNIIDAVKALPKGGPEREAYVARATSGKTKWQVENVRRTLEHLGLIVPVAVAAPTIREELMRMMSSRQPPGS